MNSVDFIGKWNKDRLYLGVQSPCHDPENPFAFISVLEGDDSQYTVCPLWMGPLSNARTN
jgi:hypothetical protein